MASILQIVLLVCLCGGQSEETRWDAAHRIESASLYGNIDAYAYYYVDLLVGTPAQRVSVILDTGSTICAFPCASCPHCGKHIDPAFDFAKSTTASWVNCGNGCAGTCSNGHCSYYQGYTEGSSMSGFWFRDAVRLGDAPQRNPVFTASVGCHQNENHLFYTQQANGIMGIAPAGSVRKTLLEQLFEDVAHVNGKVFAICLAEWGGLLTVGGYNASYHASPIQWVPMSLQGSYAVELSEARIGGQRVTTFPRHAIIDSGTTFVYMASAPYHALRAAIETHCRENGCGGASLHVNCWSLPQGHASLEQFPVVTMMFGTVETLWHARSYLYKRGQKNSWCYGFMDDGPGAKTTLGAAWMIHHSVVFDLVHNEAGIAEASCPEYIQRPGGGLAATDNGGLGTRFVSKVAGGWKLSTSGLTAASAIVCCVAVVAALGAFAFATRHWTSRRRVSRETGVDMQLMADEHCPTPT